MIYLWVRTAWEEETGTLRARVREITLATWAAIEGARIAEWEDIPDGALVVPCDEQDWFAPRLGRELEEQWAGRTVGCTWPSVTLGGRPRLRRPKVTAGNYALVKDTRAWDAACSPDVAAKELRSAPRLDVKLSARLAPGVDGGRGAGRGAPAWCRPHLDALTKVLDDAVPLT